MPGPARTVHVAHVDELAPRTLYQLLALRVDVFVVEQQCRYRELDGRDLEPGARQLWVDDADQVLATLRMLDEPDGSVRIGRVGTAVDARGEGLAAELMRRALTLARDRTVRLDAQTYLVGWYEQFGFVRAGADFLDDGIPHTPMRRGSGPDVAAAPDGARGPG
jgi:ElaA protein